MAAAARAGAGGRGRRGRLGGGAGPGGEADAPEAPAAPRDDEAAQLSPYERKRLRNIAENAEFFASLELFESAARLRRMTPAGTARGTRRVKSPKAETKTTCRRSMRLQRIDPLGVPLPEAEAQLESSVEEHARLPPGPHQMVATVQEPEADTFLHMWAKISQVEPKKNQKSTCNLESYKIHLRGMVLREEHVAKVVKSRIYSVAVHPSESRTLVAAGDKWGQIGLWDLDCSLENGKYIFIPHSQPVSCLHFSPANPAHLLSLSYDGTLRCGDVTRRIFEEIYRNEDHSLSSFDFLASDASTLVVGMWDGRVAIVDQRTPIHSPELSADLHSKTRTVHVHPISRHYFITAGERNVSIYDARHLKSRSQPVLALTGHTKSVASAYFSPVTGNRVVTTCADDTLRKAVWADLGLLGGFPVSVQCRALCWLTIGARGQFKLLGLVCTSTHPPNIQLPWVLPLIILAPFTFSCQGPGLQSWNQLPVLPS
ncbi:WD repeat-containing protein 76 isoform 2-T2 [Liasis olivaceus]